MRKKRLPPPLVKRLRVIYRKLERRRGMESIYRNFEKMMNADHREVLWGVGRKSVNKSSEHMGWRVRELKIERNFPRTEVIIKRVHGRKEMKKLSAKEAIEIVKKKVRGHNQYYSPTNYKLLEPVAYAIGGDLVAMPKINAVSCFDLRKIFSPDKAKLKIPETALKMLEELEKKGITRKQVAEVIDEVRLKSDISTLNIWLLGFEKGKFIFMALMDVS